MHARADERKQINVPAGDLVVALKALAQQSGIDLVYRSDQLEGLHTQGVAGAFSAHEAVTKLLEGTALTLRLDSSGAILIALPRASSPPQVPTPASKESSSDSVNKPTGDAEGGTRSLWSRFRLAQADQGQTTRNEAIASSGTVPDAGHGSLVEEIVVTAQKRLERLQDVPVPVTAIRAETLTNSNQLRLQDYYNKIPGLALTLSDGNQPVIAIRGVTTGGTTNPTVGIVIDDVSYGATVSPANVPAVPDIDPSDLSRVEVLRGPQGTLYGASSIGGLLKFVTVDPSTEAVSGRLQAGLVSVQDSGAAGRNFRGAVNTPLSDTFAIRASGFTIRDPGYVDNVRTAERDVNRRDSDGGRLSALWRPSDALSLKLSALVQDSDVLGIPEVNTALGGGLQQATLRGTGKYSRDAEALGATMTVALGKIDLTSATGYSVDEQYTNADAASAFFSGLANTNFAVTGVSTPFERRTEKFSQEVRATVPVGQRIEWLVGAFYTDEKVAAAVRYEAIDPGTGSVAGTMLTIATPSAFEERAAFTNITVDITDWFDIQLGGRFSENKQTFSSIRSGPIAPLFFPQLVLPELKSQDDAFTYLVTPRLKVSPDLMMYARLASGYRPGGPNSGCGVGTIPCTFGPDTTRNYEAGIKGRLFDGALSFDASLYYIDWEDIQLTLINRTPAFGYQDNATEARSRGMELSAESRPFNGLVVSAWIVWNDAELTRTLPATNTIIGNRGERLPYSSRFSGSFSVDQDFPLWGVAMGFIGGSVSHVGDRKGVFRSTVARQTYPDYTQVDLRTGMTYDTWTLSAFVNNATDKRGVLRGGLDFSVPTTFTYIQPRTVGLSLSKTF